MVKITVFTPTYNRAYIISNLYKSLRRQTFCDFEWLIVDDGSTDNTRDLVRRWQNEENEFIIRYHWQENGGKCRAINKALDLAEGELFFTVDSDDYLTDDALLKVNKWFEEISGNNQLVGIVANRGSSNNYTENYCFQEEYLDKSLLDIYSFKRNGKRVFDGERAFVFYTDFHRKYRYPEFENETFMTEAVAWNRMANDGYKMRFFNDIIWVYKYKDDGLTKAGSKLFLNNPHGFGLWLSEKAEFEGASITEKLKMYYTFTCDLSKMYDSKKIAECIMAPRFLISIMNMIHRIIYLFRRLWITNQKEGNI